MNTKSIDFVLLIPCYNNTSGLSRSIASVSYPPSKFEILIVDDGSEVPITKNDLQLVDNAVTINILRLESNQGIVQALNAGLTELKSRNDFKYIARLDAGDTCDTSRFHKQVFFLDNHKEIALLASWARFENLNSSKGYDYITKTTHQEIVKEMHRKCSFIHPTVMFRKGVLDTIGLYPLAYPHAEDYAFFWKILKSNKCAVIPEKMVKIMLANENVSSKNYKKQLRSRKEIVKKFEDNSLYRLIGVAILNLKIWAPVWVVQSLKLLLK